MVRPRIGNEDIDVRLAKTRLIARPAAAVPGAPKAAEVPAQPAPARDVGLDGGADVLDEAAKRGIPDLNPDAGPARKLKEFERLSEDSRKLAEELGGLNSKKKEIEKQLENLKKLPKVGLFRVHYILQEKMLKEQLKKVDGQIAEVSKRHDAVESRLKALREAVVNDPLPVDGNGENDPRFKELADLTHKKVDLAQKLGGAQGALNEAQKQLDDLKKLKDRNRHPVFQRHYDI